MTDRDHLLRRVMKANPLPSGHELPADLGESAPPLTLLIQDARAAEPIPLLRSPEDREELLYEERSRDMETLERQAVESVRPSRRWQAAVAALATVIVVVGAIGVVALIGGDDKVADERAVATELVDEWVAAWLVHDGEAVASLYTVDGVYAIPNGQGPVGREAIARDVETRGLMATNPRRTGPLTATEAGTFVFPMEFEMGYRTWTGEAEVTLDGSLLSRFEWLNWDPK